MQNLMWRACSKCNCIYFKSFDIATIEMLYKWSNSIWKKILHLELIYIFNTGLHSYLPITSSPSLENRYALVLGNATQSG